MPTIENKDIGSWDMSLNEGNEWNVQWTLQIYHVSHVMDTYPDRL